MGLQYKPATQPQPMTSTWRYPSLTPPGKTKQLYPEGPSMLDQINPDSELNRSSFKGFFNMVVIFSLTFLFTRPILNWVENGYFLEPYLYNVFKKDFVLCLMVWPLFFAWSFTSFVLQKMVLMGIPLGISVCFQHLTQAGLFVFSSYLILTKNWCSSHAAFVILQACVHFMKMHSYTTVNRDYRQQKIEAQRQGQQPMTHYPANINLRDFVMFMWTPWLVYEAYPRKATISWLYVARKSLNTVVCVLMTYIIHTQHLMPVLESAYKFNQPELMLRCIVPITIILMLCFYVVFESITNVFAQVSKLSHRQFYEDWWNSTTYEEFNRKWNKPVHFFLYRHVYLELIVRWRLSKNRAQMITFLFSAMLHEFLLAMIFRIIRPIFLFFICFQVPLIYFTKFMQGKKSGSYLFWLGLIIGPSIIVSCYLKISDQVAALFMREVATPIIYQL